MGRTGDTQSLSGVTNSFGQDSKSLAGFIAVGDQPGVDFTASPMQGSIPLTVAFSGFSNDTVQSWDWDFGDGSFAFVQNPIRVPTQNQEYIPSRCPCTVPAHDCILLLFLYDSVNSQHQTVDLKIH